MIEIRAEEPGDVEAIREINRCAFEQDQEANIVAALREHGAVRLSLVAALDGLLVGHILYSPLILGDQLTGAGLGPLAVLPEYQRQGIGSELVRQGNARLQGEGCPFIVVLGHPAFYPRFGFQPASQRGVTCEWEVPDEAFMLLVLDEQKMGGVSGLARYRHEFTSVT